MADEYNWGVVKHGYLHGAESFLLFARGKANLAPFVEEQGFLTFRNLASYI